MAPAKRTNELWDVAMQWALGKRPAMPRTPQREMEPTLADLEAVAAKLEREARKARMAERTKERTKSFSATLSAAMDVGDVFTNEIVQSMLQKREEEEMQAYRAAFLDPDAQAFAAGVDFLTDKLSGREEAAIKIQRAFRAYQRAKFLRRWPSWGYFRTHIPDRLWNARPTVEPLHYEIEIAADYDSDGAFSRGVSRAVSRVMSRAPSKGASRGPSRAQTARAQTARRNTAFGKSFHVQDVTPSKSRIPSSTSIKSRIPSSTSIKRRETRVSIAGGEQLDSEEGPRPPPPSAEHESAPHHPVPSGPPPEPCPSPTSDPVAPELAPAQPPANAPPAGPSPRPSLDGFSLRVVPHALAARPQQGRASQAGAGAGAAAGAHHPFAAAQATASSPWVLSPPPAPGTTLSAAFGAALRPGQRKGPSSDSRVSGTIYGTLSSTTTGPVPQGISPRSSLQLQASQQQAPSEGPVRPAAPALGQRPGPDPGHSSLPALPHNASAAAALESEFAPRSISVSGMESIYPRPPKVSASGGPSPLAPKTSLPPVPLHVHQAANSSWPGNVGGRALGQGQGSPTGAAAIKQRRSSTVSLGPLVASAIGTSGPPSARGKAGVGAASQGHHQRVSALLRERLEPLHSSSSAPALVCGSVAADHGHAGQGPYASPGAAYHGPASGPAAGSGTAGAPCGTMSESGAAGPGRRPRRLSMTTLDHTSCFQPAMPGNVSGPGGFMAGLGRALRASTNGVPPPVGGPHGGGASPSGSGLGGAPGQGGMVRRGSVEDLRHLPELIVRRSSMQLPSPPPHAHHALSSPSQHHPSPTPPTQHAPSPPLAPAIVTAGRPRRSSLVLQSQASMAGGRQRDVMFEGIADVAEAGTEDGLLPPILRVHF